MRTDRAPAPAKLDLEHAVQIIAAKRKRRRDFTKAFCGQNYVFSILLTEMKTASWDGINFRLHYS